MPEQQVVAPINWKMQPIEVRETTGIAPPNIVPMNEKFDLVAKFQGNGPGWDVFMSGETAVVTFQLEGLGAKVEKDVGPVTKVIDTTGPGPWSYEVVYTYNPATDGALPAGLYRYSCVVTFRDSTSNAVIPHLAGYADATDLLHIYPV